MSDDEASECHPRWKDHDTMVGNLVSVIYYLLSIAAQLSMGGEGGQQQCDGRAVAVLAQCARLQGARVLLVVDEGTRGLGNQSGTVVEKEAGEQSCRGQEYLMTQQISRNLNRNPPDSPNRAERAALCISFVLLCFYDLVVLKL